MATQTQTTTALPQVQTSHDDSYIPRGSVNTKLNFYAAPADGAKPFNYVETPPEGQPQRNFGDIELPVTINDIRGQESNFNIDTNAFATLTTGPSAEKDFKDDVSIKKNYYPEVEELLLKNVPGAKRILLFDHTIRRANGNRNPVTRVHIDQTKASATARVRHHLPAEAETLLNDRVRIINVWRPLNGPVQHTPLAFADSQTFKDDALIGIEHRYPDRTGETAAVRHENEQWYYWSGMEKNERLFLECFDSEKGGRVPHTAFVDPRTPEGARQRESIEVRALVFG
ncbi:hypothetical protein ABVK25_004744 [Lepraria finkii]|uniref:Methyltransferase n=1 Tax=Lepraria finkii TaxID=1340010 RepID=A0ABR4BAN0_9LECA